MHKGTSELHASSVADRLGPRKWSSACCAGDLYANLVKRACTDECNNLQVGAGLVYTMHTYMVTKARQRTASATKKRS